MVWTAETRAEVREVERHWRSNLIIRSFILALCVTDCFLFGLVDLPRQILNYVWVALIPAAIWTLVVMLVRLFRVAPIHPGVHVGFELVFWLVDIVVQIFAYSTVVPMAPWFNSYYAYSGTDRVGVFAAGVAGCLGLTILTVLHFYLFVRACVETSRARSREIATQAASIAAQIVKNMESRGTFYRRNSDVSYELRSVEGDDSVSNTGGASSGPAIRPRGGGGGSGGSGSNGSGHILGLEDLRHNTGLAPMQYSSRMSTRSHGARSTRTGRTLFSEVRTQYSHTRSLSVPVPTSPMSLRTARTDEPSLFVMDR